MQRGDNSSAARLRKSRASNSSVPQAAFRGVKSLRVNPANNPQLDSPLEHDRLPFGDHLGVGIAGTTPCFSRRKHLPLADQFGFRHLVGIDPPS